MGLAKITRQLRLKLGVSLALLALIASPLLIAQESSTTEQIKQQLEQGAKLYREQKWGQAIEAWEKVLKLDPNNARAQRYIERAQAQQTPLVPTTPTPVKPIPPPKLTIDELLKQGIQHYREAQYAQALEKWNQVLLQEPHNEKARRYIERALKKQAQSAQLEEPPASPTPKATPPSTAPTKTQTIEDPVTPLLNKGKQFYREGEYAQAIQIWEKAQKIDPSNLAVKRYIARAKEKIEEAKPPATPTPSPKPTLPPPTQKPVVQKPREPSIPQKEKIEPQPQVQPQPKSPLPFPKPEQKGEVHDYGALNLTECIQLALVNYEPAKVAREEIKLAKMRLIEARRGAYPSVSLKNGITQGTSTDEKFEGLEFTAEFQQPIMSGGRIRNSIRQAEANLAVAVKNYEKIRGDYVSEVEQAYYALSNSKKYFRDRQTLFQEAQASLEMIRKQFKMGLARQLDLLNIENQFNDISFQQISAEKDLELAYLSLRQLLELKDNEIFDIQELDDYARIQIDYDQVLSLALQRRPDVKLAELQVLFNKYAVKVAEAKNKFKVDMTASVGLNDQFFVESDSLDLQTEYFVGIKASKPLGMHTIDDNFITQDKVPSAGQTTSSQFTSNTVSISLFNNNSNTTITEARIGYMRATGDLKKAQKTTQFEVRQNYFEYQKALAQLDNADTRQQLGEEEVKILKAQTELNQAQLLDVLRALVRQYEAKANYGQAVTGYYNAITNLNKAIGISGYFNPVTGEVSEKLYRDLFKPINKPHYKIFTQITKDKPKEDILTFPPDKVTAEALLSKERKKVALAENAFGVLQLIAKPIPGLGDAITPEETREKFLNDYYLPPEKPLKPFKPWQFFRYPLLGLFEYEEIVDTEPSPQDKEAKAKPPQAASQPKQKKIKPPQVTSQTKKEIKPPQAVSKKPVEISTIKVFEEPQFIRVVFQTKEPLHAIPYTLEKPDRLLFVFDSPAELKEQIGSIEVNKNILKTIRFHRPKDNIGAFILDLTQLTNHKIQTQNDQLVILLEKSPAQQ